jgi:hypothetical protein
VEALIDVLRSVNLVAIAIVAGGQLFCLLAVLPAMHGWTGEMSAKVHQDALTHRPHRYLRAVSAVAGLSAIALLVLILVEDETAATRVLTALALVVTLISGAISSREWPINEEINSWGDQPKLERYAVLRRTWDYRHVLRTWLSMLALILFVVAAVVAEQ